ncbi:SSI family serine proteinase inhibitor [Streptomyces hydrogenans]|uniref:SSI family serine proteinase inhibitor n=1 Tax=Streptomyces hydrogenans TaxID=1873719 RepID=UPI0033304A8A
MKITTALAGAALAALALAGTAAAAPAPSTDGTLWLTVTRTTADGASTTGNLWLECPDGDGGAGHPHRASACADLAAAHGDLDALPGRQSALCSNDAVHVVATAHGRYGSRAVHWEHAYESDCHLTLATGEIFDF